VTAGALARWRAVHTWTSLACTAFLFVLGATGLPLVFRDEIDAALRPPQRARSVPVHGERASLDALVAKAAADQPGAFVEFVFWDEDDPHAVGLGVSRARGAGLDGVTRVLVDDRTGEALRAAPAEGSALDVLADVHRNLCAGAAGDALLGVMALAFLASLVSGVVVYAPVLRRVGFAALRATSRRIYWLDVHDLLGMLALAWALLVGATGFVNTLEAPLFSAWDRDTMPALLAQHAGEPPLSRTSSIDAALATAKAALPGMIPTSIGLPATPFASPRHFLVWMRGDSLFTSRLFTPVLIDASTGALARAEALPWYLRVLELCRPLHFGDYGGLALKLFWAACDAALLIVLGSGMYLWLRRVRSRGAAGSGA
jgi:uncharacterized iron-regulated membrane protein